MPSAGTVLIRAALDDRASPGLKKLQGNLAQLGSGKGAAGLSRLRAGMSQLQQGFAAGQAGGIGMVGALGTMGGAAGVAVAAVAALGAGLVAFTAAGNRAQAEADKFRLQIRALVSSADEAQAAFEALDAYADTTLFDDEQVYAAGRALLAAGMAANELVPTLEVLQAASGQNGESFQALSGALATMASRTTVTTRNLVALQAAGKVDVFGILAESLGKSREEVKSLADGGKLLTRDVLPLLLRGMATATAGLNDEMRASLPFLAHELGNAAEDASKAWATGMEPVSRVVIGGLGRALRAVEEALKAAFADPRVQAAVTALAEVLAAVGDAFGAVWELLRPVAGLLLVVLVPVLRLAAAMLRFVADALKTVARWLKPVWDWLRAVANAIKAAVEWLRPWVASMGAVAKAVGEAIAWFKEWVLESDVVKGALAAIKVVVDGIAAGLVWLAGIKAKPVVEIDDRASAPLLSIQQALDAIGREAIPVEIDDRTAKPVADIQASLDGIRGREDDAAIKVDVADVGWATRDEIQQAIDLMRGVSLPVGVHDAGAQARADIQAAIDAMEGRTGANALVIETIHRTVTESFAAGATGQPHGSADTDAGPRTDGRISVNFPGVTSPVPLTDPLPEILRPGVGTITLPGTRGGGGVGNVMMAAGGIVTRATRAIVGEGGPEAVIPLDRLGDLVGAGMSVTINVSGFADGAGAGRAAADAFRRELGLQRRLPFGTA